MRTILNNLLASILLSLNLYLPQGKKTYLLSNISIVREVDKKKEKKKLQKRSYPVARKRFVKERLLRHQKKTNPKDPRFSDQRKLRRMYRNS